jgi:wyosine [tRNA(Phe)-imidazoG37] synthetase (radical SAM superfamily)
VESLSMKAKKRCAGVNQGNLEPSLSTEGDVFFQEWLAAGQPPEQLSISSVCNARCLFCSNRMNPFPLKQNVFRDIESVKLQLSLVSATHGDGIYMSDSLPGRISEGEAFLHPQFFEILALVREKFLTNVLHFTTNAALLDEPFVRKLAPFRPMEINVSMHSTQPRLWAHIFRSTQKRAHVALESLSLLKKYHVDFTGTIVPLPRICGWDDLEKTFDFWVAQGAKSVILWWPGFSDKTPAALRKDIECPREEFQDFVKRMQEKFPRFPVIPQPNLSEPRKLPIKKIMNFTLQGNLKTFGGAFREVLWLASEAAYPEISRMVDPFAKDFSNEHHVFPVKNRSYGGNIRVSGLLMVSDFLAAGKEALELWPATDLVLIPKTAFDAFFRDLQKTPAFKIPETLGRTAWLIFENGAFQPLKGRGFVKPDQDVKKTFEKILKIFDQSIREERWDAVSSLAASFPIPTSDGLLEMDEFQNFLKRSRSATSPEVACQRRILEKLDDRRILCMEDWPTEDPSTLFSRWLFFKKQGAEWKIEVIFIGKEGKGMHNSVDTRV